MAVKTNTTTNMQIFFVSQFIAAQTADILISVSVGK